MEKLVFESVLSTKGSLSVWSPKVVRLRWLVSVSEIRSYRFSIKSLPFGSTAKILFLNDIQNVPDQFGKCGRILRVQSQWYNPASRGEQHCYGSEGQVAKQVHYFLYKFKKLYFFNCRPFERTLTLHKDNAGRLGFQFKDGKITAIAVNSSSAKNGMLIEHNLLEVWAFLSVN